MLLFRLLAVLIFLFFPIYAGASAYLAVDSKVYELLNLLEAEGISQSSLLGTKPLSYIEITKLIQEAERNINGRSSFLKEVVHLLKEEFNYERKDARFIKPLQSVYMSYSYQSSDLPLLNYNRDGERFKKGTNFVIGLDSRAELDLLSFYINPEYSSTYRDEFFIKRGYMVLKAFGFDVQIGKDSQWWGPGAHGSILLSNNAEPFKMIKLTNSEAVLLPGFLRYLGPFKLTFFVTRLEKDREIPEPYLWGARINFKPLPNLEVGLSRTALLGGRGMPESFKTWLKSFIGKDENKPGVEAGDQRAGFDIKLTIPSKKQPLQIYIDAAGEDEAGGLPYKWAYLVGLYLPRILDLERLTFRAEYATTHVSGHPNVWYTHHIYKSGYTYKNRIIGHHIGTDAENIFFHLCYYAKKDFAISFYYDREKYNLSGKQKPSKDEIVLTINKRLTKRTKLDILYSHAWLKNFHSNSIDLFKFNIIYGF